MRRHSPPPRAHLLRPPPPLSSPSGGIPRKFARPEAPSRNSSRVSLKFPPFPGFDRTQIRHYVAADSGKKTKSKIQRKSKSRLAKKKKKKKARLRAPMTPMTSKLKKYKIKAYP